MKYDHLIQAIEDGAEEKIREISESKDREIRKIQERANEESAQLHHDLLAETRRKIEVENNKRVYSAREQVKELLSKARHQAYQEVFMETELRLTPIRSDPSYPVFFEAILAETTGSLDSNKVRLNIDKQDEALCRKLTENSSREFEIIPDLITRGGLNGSTPDGKVIVRNTIEDRLVRARERMKIVVFSGLYGEPDVR